MLSNPRHHATPKDGQPQIEASRNHVEQQALDVMLTRVGEDLQEDVHIRVHGPDEILVHPHGEVPEHAPELDGEDGHGADHHHGDRVARQHHDQGKQGVDAEQQHRLHHGECLQDGGHGYREHRRGGDHTA